MIELRENLDTLTPELIMRKGPGPGRAVAHFGFPSLSCWLIRYKKHLGLGVQCRECHSERHFLIKGRRYARYRSESNGKIWDANVKKSASNEISVDYIHHQHPVEAESHEHP